MGRQIDELDAEARVSAGEAKSRLQRQLDALREQEASARAAAQPGPTPSTRSSSSSRRGSTSSRAVGIVASSVLITVLLALNFQQKGSIVDLFLWVKWRRSRQLPGMAPLKEREPVMSR